MSELISIIIPAYNIAPWIGKCLESVLNQSYKNVQIIVVDDGSKDDTGKICERYAEIDNRVRVIHQINSGVSAARNRGLELAEGELLCFVDGDDWIEPDYIEKLYNQFCDREIQLSICGFIEENEEGIIKGRHELPPIQQSAKDVLEMIFFNDGIGRSLWNKMLKRGIVEKYQIRFSTEYQVGEDMIFLIQYLKKIERVAFSSGSGYHYLWRIGSAMQKRVWNEKYYNNRLSWLRALEEVENLLENQDKKCIHTFDTYRQLVQYRILCESVSLDGCGSLKNTLERELLKKVRQSGRAMLLSGKLSLKTSVGVILCCISPKLQIKFARMRN